MEDTVTVATPQQPATTTISNSGGSDFGKRTKVACKSCHRRRVKCDATDEQPCWHCRLRGTRCELIESRRGKYVRKKSMSAASKPVGSKSGTSLTSGPSPAGVLTPPVHDTRTPDGTGQPSPPSAINRDDSSHARTRVSTDLDNLDSLDNTTPDTTASGPEMLYTRILEGDYAGATHSPPGTAPLDNSARLRYFYMGEPFSLAFVIRSLSDNPAMQNMQNGVLQLHHPIPHTVPEYAQDGAEAFRETDPSVRAVLDLYGAFEVLPQPVSDELVRLFFQLVHPAYPVLDRQEFVTQYRRGRMSLLALQSIYYLALTVCSEATVRAAGFPDRLTARRALYLRAKALYDTGYEKNKVTVVAVLFLFGFWWEGPEDQKDSWHWLSAAVSLAQTLGMHRSTALSGMHPRQRSMLKRIWWSIYIRDRHAAAALGRPCRIQDEDCDVEMLTEDDFLIDITDSSLVLDETAFHRRYVIEMARLAQVLGRLLKQEYAPHGAASTAHDDIYSELASWEQNLSPDLRRAAVDESLEAPFWSCMLYANYHTCQILLLRPKGAFAGAAAVDPLSSSPRPANHGLVEKSARLAADSITRIVEDLLAAGTMRLAQLHLVPALFAALSIHTVVIQRSDGVQKQLAENRARQCILAFGELAKGWPVAGWILRMFINLMKKLTGERGPFPQNNPISLQQHDTSQQHPHQQQQQPHPQQPLPQQPQQCITSPRQDLSALPYIPVDGTFVDDGSLATTAGLNHTNQLISDIIWAPVQGDFDCDFIFGNTQVNSGFVLM
ncbi:hypothetical protein SEUCBS139899_006789 [Sporothrix eucalyptigena]|uniref:Zn(2)-C6 fungal-type domain-containing protein n=1 Tax=Sporothrix eucalyptigena TaxID=1812306 RepID=A0ABP0CX37_9PEZI